MGTWRRISEGRVFPIIPVILILLAGLVMVGVVAFIPTRSPQSQKEELPLVNVEVEAVRSVAEVADTFDLPGVVEPERVVKVSAEVASRIEGILRIEGEKVEERDPIVELNTDFYLAEFKRAKVQAEFVSIADPFSARLLKPSRSWPGEKPPSTWKGEMRRR